MRRMMLVLLCLLLLPGCQRQTVEEATQPVAFYYQRNTLQYGVDDGVIAAETVDINGNTVDYLQLLRRYLQGPRDPALSLPVPDGTQVLSFSLENNIATVTMSRELGLLSGHALTVGVSCIAKTLLQFETVHTVRIFAEQSLLNGAEYLEFDADTLLLYDEGAVENRRIKLYFADSNYHFLLETIQSVNHISGEQLAEYALQQLIAGPVTPDARPVLPTDTMVLDVNVEGGTCIVDFSGDFLVGKPTGWLRERASIFAIVNTLASLEGVEQVQILVEGEALKQYLYLDLSKPLLPDEEMLGPVRSGLGEFEVSVCLPMTGRSGYFTCPVRVQGSATEEPAKQALEAHIAYPRGTCYEQLLPAELVIQQFTVTEGICHVDFSEDPLAQCQTKEQRERCIQSMVLTVNQTEMIEAMHITVNGTPLEELHTFDQSSIAPKGRYLLA